jgi:hypothetical protein
MVPKRFEQNSGHRSCPLILPVWRKIEKVAFLNGVIKKVEMHETNRA